jgi:ABC-type amino acid transport substrate-binding protein
MKSRLLFVLVFVALAGVSSMAQDLPEIVERGTLRVLAAADEDPAMFNWTGQGEPGFEREMIESFARLHKLDVEPVKVERFADIIPALLNSEGDVIIGIIDTAERRQRIDFSIEVLPATHVAVSYAPHQVVDSVEQLKKETVGTVQGTTWWKAAVGAGIPEATLKPFPNRAEMLEALDSGDITASVMSLSDFTLALKKDPKLQGGVVLGERSSAAFGLRQESKALKAALNQHLGNLRRGQGWNRLVIKYFGSDALTVLGRASAR